MPTFTPPTVEQGMLTDHPLFRRFRLTVGVSVLIKDGAVSEKQFPFQDEVEAADYAFVGGSTYTIDQETADILTAAGYTVGA